MSLQTELDRVRLRTSHRYWPAMLFLAAPIALITVLLALGVTPLPDAKPITPQLRACDQDWQAAADPACDPYLPVWVQRMPTEAQYLNWLAHDAYVAVQGTFVEPDPDPAAVREALIAERNRTIARTLDVSYDRYYLQRLTGRNAWAQTPPDPPATLAAAYDVRASLEGHGGRYESRRVLQRATSVRAEAQARADQLDARRRVFASNLGLYAVIAAGILGLLALLGYGLRHYARDVVLTAHQLRVGRRQVDLRDIERIDLDERGATLRLRQGRRLRVPIDDASLLLDFVPVLDAAVSRSRTDPSTSLSDLGVAPELAALRRRSRERAT